MPAKSNSQHPKVHALLEEGTLNPVPEKVRDPKFQDNEFFDPRDIVQVKYEMLRRVSVENASVVHATEEYGVSRPTYYQTKASFDEAGIAGFVPKKRGPRGPHKLQGAVLEFVQKHLVAGKPIRARELAKLVRQEFGLNVHPRTIERAVAGKKNSEMKSNAADSSEASSSVVAQYETLRGAALGGVLPPEARYGLMLFLRRGMWGWTRTIAIASAMVLQQRSGSSVVKLDGLGRAQSRGSCLRGHGDERQQSRSNNMNDSLKVQPHHLERGAYLYIRQSSMRQVIENVESTKRQYALRSRAIALGWRDDQIIVIDNDQGESGASAAWREGFQRLVTDVGMGHAGIVMGLEVSRLARNNADWHRLLEICALADTLILDEDGDLRSGELQRPSAARSQRNHERSRASRPQSQAARRNPQQGATRRVSLSAAHRLCLRRGRQRRARP